MLENFLTDELTLAVAIGGEPNALWGAECLANGSELGGFVAALCWAGAVNTFQAATGSGHRLFHWGTNIFRFEQVGCSDRARKPIWSAAGNIV